ncbi:MAG: amidohydrolase family protein [Cognatishimia sp.]|uniref:amidohydrolase family protein n=1 Tax=Cognatishimia sp. TaxID=2211648 RepID=UPI003B8B35ED
MIVDAHQHFWTLARGDYPWPNETVAPIFRDFGPEDLAPLLVQSDVDRTVLVQATDTIEETEFLLQIAAKTDWVAGVVGWVDLSADDAISIIDTLLKNRDLKGLRPMLQNIENTDWILDDRVAPALTHMARVGLCFDALVQPRHLLVLTELAKRHPSLKIVIDHAAKPQMGAGKIPSKDWSNGMRQLSRCSNVLCKLSGMVTEIGPDWRLSDIEPFAKQILENFGAARTMFGSDWPVVNLASDYAQWRGAVDQLLKGLTDADRSRVLGLNAMEFYKL